MEANVENLFQKIQKKKTAEAQRRNKYLFS